MEKLISQSKKKIPVIDGIYKGIQSSDTGILKYNNTEFEFKVNKSYRGVFDVDIIVKDGLAYLYEPKPKETPKKKKKGKQAGQKRVGSTIDVQDLKIFGVLLGCVLIYWAYTIVS